MAVNKKRTLFAILCLVILILSSCSSKTNTVEQIYNNLEKVAAKEEAFLETQQQIIQLENDENVLFEKIIALGMAERDEMNKLVNDALEINNSRYSYIVEEKEYIDAAQKEFANVAQLIEKIDEDGLQSTGTKLINSMSNRYEAYNKMFENYIAGLEVDQQLYELMKQENNTVTELEKLIFESNEKFGQALNANEIFNNETEIFNELKIEFYKQAGFEITL